MPPFSSARKRDDAKSEFHSKEQDETSFTWTSISGIKDTDIKVDERKQNFKQK